MQASVEKKEKEEQSLKRWCPVCKENTEHEYAFFDTVFCKKCKVLRVER